MRTTHLPKYKTPVFPYVFSPKFKIVKEHCFICRVNTVLGCNWQHIFHQ